MDIVQESTGAVSAGPQRVTGGIEFIMLVTKLEKGRGNQCTWTKTADRGDVAIKEKGMAFERLCTTTGTSFTGKTHGFDLSGEPVNGIFAKGLLFEEQLVDPGLNVKWHEFDPRSGNTRKFHA
jgi:hypothetical protein